MHNTRLAAEDLPAPAPEAQAHSERLRALIIDEIGRCGGRISFARFMELALYAPGLGYYAAGARKFGAGGDFVTAPEISPLFSRCLARQCREVLAGLGGGDILEFGAGSGVMAADILLELERLGQLPCRYFILELSAELRARQRETLTTKTAHLLERVVWLETWPQQPLRGVVLANEVLDAMPVHRFRVEEHGLSQAYVVLSDGRFTEQFAEPGPELSQRDLVQVVAELPPGYVSEYNAAAAPWLQGIASALEQGVVLLIDYGFPRREFYHPQRASGTLMCHYRHRAHSDPFVFVGLQDITAHVDFTLIAEAALAAGFEVRGFTSQAYFLLALGLTELLAEVNPVDVRAQLEYAQQIKKLTLPNEMGELFKVMALAKGMDLPLQGFALNDQRQRL
ncbi:MAG: SAM-dependent methyltransferase [Pseudomonadota bacterium]